MDYMTTLDLKDAYLSVPVQKDSQTLVQFLRRNTCFVFQGLCFGLNTAPRVYAKLLKPVAARLRNRGVRMIFCLDVFLILGSPLQQNILVSWRDRGTPLRLLHSLKT